MFARPLSKVCVFQCPLLIDGHAYSLAVLFLLKNRFFGPRTAKSQSIWIKFCTLLLLYGIHLWADLYRDRYVGGSSPGQTRTTLFLVILVTHPKSYIQRRRIAAISAANRQSGGEDGWHVRFWKHIYFRAFNRNYHHFEDCILCIFYHFYYHVCEMYYVFCDMLEVFVML